jgi:RecB family exonuclease
MDPFIAQLAALCSAHPTRAKWVFVPTHAIGRSIGDRLVLGGTDWANLRFVTPLDVALRMGAPFLVERGIDPSEEGLGPALIMSLLIDLPEEVGYFRSLADQPQMAVALWSTLRELRMAGVRASDLKSEAFESADKHTELRALLTSYESFLANNARGDLATVFDEAVLHSDWCPIQPADCWLEQPDVVWSPLQRRLIDAMPGERISPAAFDLPGLALPHRLQAVRVDRRAPDADASLAFLMQPERAHLPSVAPGAAPPAARAAALADSLSPRGSSVFLFHAGGAEAEVEEIFRRILGSGRSLDQTEIVCASPSYSALIWDKAMRYEWPVTVAQGIQGALTRPGRALLAFTDWIADDFAAGRLRRMLQGGDLAMGESFSITSGRAARLLVKARAAWGRDTYRLSLRRLAMSSRTGAKRDDLAAEVREGLEKRAKQADELAAWIDGLIRGVPVPGADRRIDLHEIVDCARQFIDRFTARSSALDALAASFLAEAIGDLRALESFRCPLEQALRFLRERVESVHVGADRPRPGHLHVSSLTTAGFAGRPLVFVAGLEEGRVFPAPFEDPILLDAEREKISPALPRAHDRTDEAVYLALSRLAALSAMPGATVSLSYSCRDNREYRPTYASWLLLQAYRVTSGNPKATYQQLHESLGSPKSAVPDAGAQASCEAAWWLRGVTQAGEASRPAVFDRYRPLEAGDAARAARESSAFTQFDGDVPAAGAVLDPCLPAKVISPTQIEDAASCPFRHFLRRGLGVEAIEVGERDRDVWLDPLLRGTLLHDLYAEFLRRCRAANRRAVLPADQIWLRTRGEQTLAELAVEMPPPSEEVRSREARLFLDDLALFAEAEANLDPARTPIAFEVGFGRAVPTFDEPLAQAEPIVIDIGGGRKLRIAGRMDRIDRVGPSTYEIVDYKTGGYWADGWKGTFAGGTRLQHALYGLAALELLKRQDKNARVTGAEYYFSSAKGQQERKRIPTPSAATVATVLNDVREVIASGAFVHAATDEPCRFCDYGHACGRNAADRAAAKLADSKLASFVRLASHE